MKLKWFFLLSAICYLLSAFLTGCGKKEEMSVRKVRINEIGKQDVCPVTKNKFTVTGETKAVDYKGQTYYFCCPGCDGEFIKDPEKYIVSRSASNVQRPTKDEVLYWTCSMHPQVRSDEPGKCPICAMTLIPVYKGEEDKIIVDENTKKITGLKSRKAENMHLAKIIRLPGRVANDNDLYLAQQEYISSYKNKNKEMLEASKFRLSLLGYSEKDISELQKMDEPDKSLIYPGKNVWIYAQIYEYDTGLIKPGLSVYAISSAYPNVNFKGVVRFIEPTLNQQTRSATARVSVEDPDGLLKLEMYAVIEIKINYGNVLSVPENALIDTGTRKLVYLDMGNGRYKPQEVKTGFAGEGYVEIVRGIKAGDAVVTDGNFMLDSQSTLTGGQSLLYGGAEEVKSEREKKPEAKPKHH